MAKRNAKKTPGAEPLLRQLTESNTVVVARLPTTAEVVAAAAAMEPEQWCILYKALDGQYFAVVEAADEQGATPTLETVAGIVSRAIADTGMPWPAPTIEWERVRKPKKRR